MALVRSQTSSDRQPHSDGQVFPPKVSLVKVRANSSSGKNVQHLRAVFHARCILRKADLKSILEQRIWQRIRGPKPLADRTELRHFLVFRVLRWRFMLRYAYL